MSNLENIVKKNSNQFSFISTFFDLVGNKEFKLAEISTLYTKTETKETSFWRSLSAVSELLGETFYDNTLNFIDNVCNIDLCKIELLQSMISKLGINYSVFNDIKFMPIDILKLLDILSIKREYLISYLKMNHVFVDSLLSGYNYNKNLNPNLSTYVINEPNTLSDTISSCENLNLYRNLYIDSDNTLTSYWSNNLVTFNTSLDDDKYEEFIEHIYYNVLNNKIRQTYNDKNETYIYKHLSDNILLSSFELPNNTIDIINSYKVLYNIPYSFNVLLEADKYENGEIDLSVYNEQEIKMLNIEFDRRKEPFKQSELKTRYKFYKEREVKEYTEFILNEYSVTNLSDNYLSSIKYDIDDKYIEVFINKDDKSKLFYNALYGIEINNNILSAVVKQLAKITFSIRDIRELLKTLCQKNYMKGTSLFLKFLITDYIKQNIITTLNNLGYLNQYKFDSETTQVNLIEYTDPTNYNNIVTETDLLLSDSITTEFNTLNKEYWISSLGLDAIGAIDTTNIFAQLPTLMAQNFIFNEKTLSDFYINTLKTKFVNSSFKIQNQNSHLLNFLNNIYSLGAENTFLSNGIFHTYDSYELKKQYDELSTNHINYKNLVIEPFSYLSNKIPDIVNQNVSLDKQLSQMFDIFYDGYDTDRLQKIENTKNLSNILYDINELTSNIRLSSLYTELNDKYTYIEYIKYELYNDALLTDSFAKQLEYSNLCATCEFNYNNISVKYQDASVYIPENFKQLELKLSTQIINLCLLLSSLDSEIIEQGKDAVYNLSNAIYVANEMSSVIELEIILETLSAKYELLVTEKYNDLTSLQDTDIFKYRKQIFDQYTGNIIGNTPYYYLENIRHPSFMLHPYLSNYIELEDYNYPIENIANIILENVNELIKNNISNYIDIDGYLINIWKNPINSNTEYLSRYEQINHITDIGIQNEVVGYDGLFYPKALYDFLNDDIEYSIETDDGIKTGNFLDALSGCEIINSNTNLTTNICYNPWYKHLNLSKNERLRIRDQLSVFKDDISHIAKTNKSCDIFKYGLDIYNNAYCLLKTYDKAINNNNDYNNIDYDIKCNATGLLWIRFKNHPIAFPMIVSNNEKSIDDLSCSLIINKNNCNFEYHALAYNKLSRSNFYTPAIYDFTFSPDKNLIVLNGKLKNEEHSTETITTPYPIISLVLQNYDDINELTYCSFGVVNSNNPIYSIIDETYLRKNMKDWNFQSYFYNDNKLGVIYSNILTSLLENSNEISNTITIYGAYYDILNSNIKRKTILNEIVDTVITYNDSLENVCLDVNDNIATIAYLDMLPSSLSNYTKIDISSVSTYTELKDNDYSIKTKQYIIGEQTFLHYNERSYVSYTDIGCYGLIENNSNISINNLGYTYLGKYDIYDRGIYKFQILAKPIADITSMIDFRYTALIRPYENYKDDITSYTTPLGTTFNCITYFNAHYYETLLSETTKYLSNYQSISSNVNVYDPYAFKECLLNTRPVLKTDEEYTRITDNEHIPYLFVLSNLSDDIPLHFKTPFNLNNISDNNCSFTFFETEDFPLISTSWCMYTDDDNKQQIQIDFNSLFYKSDNNNLSINNFNQYNLFLNLEKAGSAGILNIYKNPLENNYELLAQYYIKNISDTKPKFLLSANNTSTVEYDGFLFDGSIYDTSDPLSILVAEGNIYTKIVNEKTHISTNSNNI